MTVIRLDQWLKNGDPLAFFKHLDKYFPKANAWDIYDYFMMHGMDNSTFFEGRKNFQHWERNKLYDLIEKEVQILQKLWDGPDMPIFILPADTQHPVLKSQQGKSGLAFPDKLFLFITEKLEWNEIKALLTHEYNHVCRLKHYKKPAENYTLLDAIVLEGLAEWAVSEYVGKELVGHWVKSYSEEQMEHIWRSYIYLNREVKKDQPLYDSLLYGRGKYPPMSGYCAGWFLVITFVKERPLSMKELLQVPSSEFVT